MRPIRLYLLASVLPSSTALALDTPSAEGLDIYIGGELSGTKATGSVGRSLQLIDNRTSSTAGSCCR